MTLFPEMKGYQDAEDTWAPPKEDDKFSSRVERELTPLASMDAEASMEKQEVKGQEFPKVEKQRSVGVRREAGGGDEQDGRGRPGPRC